MLSPWEGSDDYWDERWYAPLIHSHEGSDDLLVQAIRERVANPKRARHVTGFTESDLIRLSKEIIFRIDDGKPSFHHVTWTLDAGTGELECGPSWAVLGLESARAPRT